MVVVGVDLREGSMMMTDRGLGLRVDDDDRGLGWWQG